MASTACRRRPTPLGTIVDPRRLAPEQVPRELYDGELQNAPPAAGTTSASGPPAGWMGVCAWPSPPTSPTQARRRGKPPSRNASQRTSRLITMGEMASTLAHELNQPLAAIANYPWAASIACSPAITARKTFSPRCKGQRPGRAGRQDHPAGARIRQEERAARHAVALATIVTMPSASRSTPAGTAPRCISQLPPTCRRCLRHGDGRAGDPQSGRRTVLRPWPRRPPTSAS